MSNSILPYRCYFKESVIKKTEIKKEIPNKIKCLISLFKKGRGVH